MRKSCYENSSTVFLQIEYVLTSILVFIVQLFYINTIRAREYIYDTTYLSFHVLTYEYESVKAPLIIILLLIGVSLTSLATGLVLPAVQLKLHDILTIVVSPLNHLAFNIARGTALACDLSIVAVLCWQLGIRKTNVQRANNMINALIMFSVQRGVLQAVVQLGEVLSASDYFCMSYNKSNTSAVCNQAYRNILPPVPRNRIPK